MVLARGLVGKVVLGPGIAGGLLVGPPGCDPGPFEGYQLSDSQGLLIAALPGPLPITP